MRKRTRYQETRDERSTDTQKKTPASSLELTKLGGQDEETRGPHSGQRRQQRRRQKVTTVTAVSSRLVRTVEIAREEPTNVVPAGLPYVSPTHTPGTAAT